MALDLGALYLDDMRERFESYRSLAERAFAQTEPSERFIELSPGGNSIAHLMKHIAGNLRSRWTDFLTSDGEKPDRNRDTEFELGDGDDAQSLERAWNAGWELLFAALDSITPADLERTVLIRHEPHSVISAMNRALGHYAMHVGQIVLIAKHLRGERWQTLSIPRGGTEQFNKAMAKRRSQDPE